VAAGPGSAPRPLTGAEVGYDEPSTERGLTLVELLVSVVIVGFIATAMMLSLTLSTKSSDMQRRGTLAAAEGRRYIEYIRARPYHNCAGKDTAPPPAAQTSPYRYDTVSAQGDIDSSVTAYVSNVEFYVFTSPQTSMDGGWQPTCPIVSGVQTDPGVQKVTVTVLVGSTTNDRISRSFSVVKRFDD
jgi:prepilin-type N-terminal cleavage/methylation domain-containing protein